MCQQRSRPQPHACSAEHMHSFPATWLQPSQLSSAFSSSCKQPAAQLAGPACWQVSCQPAAQCQAVVAVAQRRCAWQWVAWVQAARQLVIAFAAVRGLLVQASCSNPTQQLCMLAPLASSTLYVSCCHAGTVLGPCKTSGGVRRFARRGRVQHCCASHALLFPHSLHGAVCGQGLRAARGTWGWQMHARRIATLHACTLAVALLVPICSVRV